MTTGKRKNGTEKEHKTHLCIPLKQGTARVFGDEPQFIDEPTSGLDPVSRDELLHIFKRIVSDGTRCILFSTHITSDLDRCADDITYIRGGQVLKSADMETFLASFAHLKEKEDTAPLTLEEIMLRTERRERDEPAL